MADLTQLAAPAFGSTKPENSARCRSLRKNFTRMLEPVRITSQLRSMSTRQPLIVSGLLNTLLKSHAIMVVSSI